MAVTSTASSRTAQRVLAVSIAAIVVGALLFLVSVIADLDGFGGGFLQGAGAALTAAGTYFWGYATGLRRSSGRGAWLPSQDPRA